MGQRFNSRCFRRRLLTNVLKWDDEARVCVQLGCEAGCAQGVLRAAQEHHLPICLPQPRRLHQQRHLLAQRPEGLRAWKG